MHELRHAIRMLRHKPAFTALAALTLAVGVGANTALFSLIDAVLLRPLPFPEPDRLVALWETVPRKFRVAPANYLDWERQSDVFEGMAAFSSWQFQLTGAGEPLQLTGMRATPGFFTTLRPKPRLGRLLVESDAAPDAPRVVLLSQQLWRGRFGADPGIIGKPLRLDEELYTVVGILPEGPYPSWPTSIGKFSFLDEHQQFVVPLSLSGDLAANRRSHVLGVVARLKDSATLEKARSQMDAIAARLALEHPEFNQGEGVLVKPLMDEVVGEVQPALLALMGGVGLLLLVACANVGGIFMARANGRGREFAIRAALGASRARLGGQLMLESLGLALLGGALGVWFAFVGLDALTGLAPRQIPRLDQVGIDGRVLGFGLAVSVLSGVAFGLLPTLRLSVSNQLGHLRQSCSSDPVRVGRNRKALVVVQVAMAFALLFGSGLLALTFRELRAVDCGFDPENTLVVSLSLPASRYEGIAKISGFTRRLLEGAKDLPGAKSAALAYDTPLEANWTDGYTILGEARPDDAEPAAGQLRQVSADYFPTAGIPILRGRGFTSDDDLKHPGAVVINQALAARDFPDRDPIGTRLSVPTPSAYWGDVVPAVYTIVGVVGDVRFLGPGSDSEPAFYLCSGQFPLRDMSVLVRTTDDPSRLVARLRGWIAEIDPLLPLTSVATLESMLAERVAQPRFNMLIMALFGTAAALLAGLGIFGLLSQSVLQRTREIGVRIAVGADRRDILKAVAGEGLILAAAGVAVGTVVSLALGDRLSHLLFQVDPMEPWLLAAVSLAVLGVALVACWAPARQATRVDPIKALRWD